jgi:hypothetical protein
MRFNADRLARLAGIQTDTSRRRSLNEAGNQSRRDEGYDEGYDYYQGDLSEADAAPDPFAEFREDDDADADMLSQLDAQFAEGDLPELAKDEGDVGDEVHHATEGEHAEAHHAVEGEHAEAHHAMETKQDEMVEINETMLRREIARMRKERSQRSSSSRRALQEENQLRMAIRSEIGSIIGDLKNSNLYSTRDWLYGDKKPKNSRDGYVARGGFGIGF